jgi:hypothetical protein
MAGGSAQASGQPRFSSAGFEKFANIEMASRLAAAEERMRLSVEEIAAQDGITIPASPRGAFRLTERFLPEHGGYLLYALLSTAGVHPGAARAPSSTDSPAPA